MGNWVYIGEFENASQGGSLYSINSMTNVQITTQTGLFFGLEWSKLVIDKLWRPLGQVGSFKNQFLLRSPWKPESRGTTRGILSSSRKRSDHSGLGGHTWFILLKFLAELISRI
ncbi:hypothetical protein V6N13_084451 [Hibiscus sabdariffa]